MNKIYTVTAINEKNKRVWGWYADLYEAEEAVINNITDMNEAGYYPHILIEEVEEGILPITTVDKQRWYQFDEEDENYHKCEQPEEYKKILNWAMG